MSNNKPAVPSSTQPQERPELEAYIERYEALIHKELHVRAHLHCIEACQYALDLERRNAELLSLLNEARDWMTGDGFAFEIKQRIDKLTRGKELCTN